MTVARCTSKLSLLFAASIELIACAPSVDAIDTELDQGVSAQEQVPSTCDAGCYVPRAAPVCRVAERTSVSLNAVAQALITTEPERLVERTIAYRTGDAFTLLPTPTINTGFLRVTRTGAVEGASLSRVDADMFVVAGAAPAEELIGLRLGGPGVTAAALDLATLQFREPHAFSLDLRLRGQTREVVAAPAFDGRRSVFAVGNRYLGPVDIGMIGPGGAPVGPVTRVCNGGRDCECFSVLPTQDAGIVSILELPRADDQAPEWRTITLDASGKVVRNVSLPVTLPKTYGCPLVVGSDGGAVGLFGPSSAPSLLRADDPTHPVRLITAPDRATRGLSVSGDEAIVLESGEPPSVARAHRGVVDAASRLELTGAGFGVQVIASQGSDLTLYYPTEKTREILTVSCR